LGVSDTGDVLARLRAAAAGRTAAGVRRTLSPRDADFGGMLDMASNDYLGLCGHPRLVAGAVAAASEWGTGSTGSRLVTGTTVLHERLEAELAAFAGAAGALVFSSGYLANLSVVTALTAVLRGRDGHVLIVSDERNHASLIDACRLARGSRVRLEIYPHRDVAAATALLATRTEESALLVSDAVFSVDGASAPVTELYAAARAHGALLVLDEAHAFGVAGPDGRGLAYAAGLAGAPDLVRTVTLSKSLASQGGAVLGATEVIDTIVDTGRGFIFDTGLAPPSAGAALAALGVLADEPERARRAVRNAGRLADIVAGLGLTPQQPSPPQPSPRSPQSPQARPQAAVLAVVLGEPWHAVEARDSCARSGVRVGCFRPPSVPDGQACLRLTARATMTESDFSLAERALSGARGHTRVDVHPLFRQ
jgi:8-amino-7-oxononanoate synthase